VESVQVVRIVRHVKRFINSLRIKKTMGKIRSLPKQFVSRKLIKILLDDFAFAGSVPFFLLVTMWSYFVGNIVLFYRLLYGLIISFVVIIIVKGLHYKDRPRKEEFSTFMEKIVASSFPSVHSLIVTGISTLLILSYPYPWVIAMTGILAILVYIQRYVSRKHFVIDIIGGFFIALAIIIFVVRVIT